MKFDYLVTNSQEFISLLETTSDSKWEELEIYDEYNSKDVGVPVGYHSIKLDFPHPLSTIKDADESEIARKIGNLNRLKRLRIRIGYLGKLVPEICKLTNLVELDISKNNIYNLPDEIGKLINLEILNLSDSQLTVLPTEIGSLRKLRYLLCGENQIETIPEEIGQLQNLEALTFGTYAYTFENEQQNTVLKIRDSYLAPEFVVNNQIRVVPKEILELKKLWSLDFRGNPLPIPPEILRKTNEPQIILNYYFSLSPFVRLKTEQVIVDAPAGPFTGALPLNETKLLVVGQGAVGKTSIVHRIVSNDFNLKEDKTDGISISQWHVDGGVLKEIVPDLEGPLSKIKLNIWDFGGQEIMHATHQFFLTKRSLYLLALDARLTQEENRVEYWLKIIQSFGGESPVLIVGNKTDQHPLDIDRTGLQKKYPNIVGILETSATTGAGIAALKAEIAKQVDTLPHVRDLLPETWFTVKSKLEELGREKNFITQDEYLNLCTTNDITDETSQHTLIGFLHDLGVVLHFQDDPRLEALGILNPQWVTNGVYMILNSHELFQNQGTLTLPILGKTLIPPIYPSNKRLFIVDMMKKFELCYDIEPDKSFLIPDLLPKDEPFTGEWDGALAFQIHYNILPSSIISRFIVRMNAFIHKTIWRSGVVLKRGDNTALVKADIEDKKIYIWVNGKEDTRRDLLAMIRGEFDAIHKTIAKIEAVEKVPVPNAPEAAPVDLTFLQRMASEGRESLPVQVGNRIIDVIVKEVLGQIEKEGKSSQPNMVVQIDKMYGGVIGNNNIVNITQTFESVYEAIENSSLEASKKNDVTDEVDIIKNEVAKGEQANESFLSRRLRNLKKMAPDIADVALAALANPVAGVGMLVQKVAKKIKEETK